MILPPRSQRRRGSTRQREGRARETAAHHPARSVRHVRVRKGRRARRMGGLGGIRVCARWMRRSWKARRARRFARAFSASTRSAGRRWCRSSRRARRIGRRLSSCWRSGWSSASVRPTSRPRVPAAEEEIAFAASLSDHPEGHAGGRVAQVRGRGDPRGVSHADPERRAEAVAGLRVPRGGRRRRAAEEHVDLMTMGKGERT